MRQHIIDIILALLVTLLIGCATSKQTTQLVEHISVDTLYLHSQQYDSIYIYQDRLLDRSKDTLYLKEVSIEYRYKLLRDTVRIAKRDSIPYEVTVVETKEITRPLTAFDYLCRACFFLILGTLFVRLFRIIRTRLCN